MSSVRQNKVTIGLDKDLLADLAVLSLHLEISMETLMQRAIRKFVSDGGNGNDTEKPKEVPKNDNP